MKFDDAKKTKSLVYSSLSLSIPVLLFSSTLVWPVTCSGVSCDLSSLPYIFLCDLDKSH